MTRDELIRRLRQVARENGLSFEVIKSRGKGSHVVVRSGDRRTVVPYGHGRDLKLGTLRSIAGDLGVDFRRL
jgi:predicted RNA binding protein YcfA (HicA-like mRNA interferase family)